MYLPLIACLSVTLLLVWTLANLCWICQM